MTFLQMQHLSMSNKRKCKYEKYCFIFLNIGKNIGSPNILKWFVSGNVLAGEVLNNEIVHCFLRRLGFLSFGALPEVFS